MNQPTWSHFYSPRAEILAYIESIVEKYKLSQYIKLRHELVHAAYNESSGKWHLRIRRLGPPDDPTKYEEFEEITDVFFSCIGQLHRWSWPDIPGLSDYKGKIMHSAAWDLGGAETWQESVKDWGEKKVSVIGVVRELPPFNRVN